MRQGHKFITIGICAGMFVVVTAAQEPGQFERLREFAQVKSAEAERTRARAAASRAESAAGRERQSAERERQAVQRAAREREREYARGARAMDKHDWVKAREYFNAVAEAGGARTDGAMYWEAYALYKQAETLEAQAVLRELSGKFPESRWLNDAEALELFMRQAAPGEVQPGLENNDELKLYAINALANTDPERAVPLLKKVLEEPSHPKLKERALFVLAMTESPEAIPIVENLARGGGNPDLQTRAIKYLGLLGGEKAGGTLDEIYQAGDADVKRQVIRAYMHAELKDRVVAVAESDAEIAIRREAVRNLGVMRADEELKGLYRDVSDSELKLAALRSLALAGESAFITDLARNESDPELRGQAIRHLGMSQDEKATETLLAVYGDADTRIRRAVLWALYLQRNAPALVELARKETDPDLKKYAVHRLSNMEAPEATEYMMELLAR